jgi:predicted acetyltransferase
LDHALAEFFILRKYRRLGIGSQAAKLVFERFPGRWEMAVMKNNRPALSFWRCTIAAVIPENVEECEGDGNRWLGTVFCFRAGASRSDSLRA